VHLHRFDLAVFELVLENKKVTLLPQCAITLLIDLFDTHHVDLINPHRTEFLDAVAVKFLRRKVRIDDHPALGFYKQHRGVVFGEHIAKLLFAPSQLLFDLFTRSYILVDPKHHQRVPLCIARKNFPAIKHPHPRAVFMFHATFTLVIGQLPPKMFLQKTCALLQILRM